jgi:cellulose synthase/poly-beta-1,6-N-acetylglucosamine synthase-like glycosyltransferase
MILLACLAWAIGLFVIVPVLYRSVFALSYLTRPRSAAPAGKASHRRYAVLIPAHNEELLIDAVIESVRSTSFPQGQIFIHVIADNCTDATADRVRMRGEQVHERSAADNPGKGQALDWMLDRLDLDQFNAVVLFDADNLVDVDFFSAIDEAFGRGHRCLQGYYGIANPDDSVMTRLLAVTYVMKNLLFNAGKARLGLSVGLMGTGMAFRSDVLARSGWQAMSIGEDLEQTFILLKQGEKIRFVPEAQARAQEATNLRQGYTQRQRWATGRSVLATTARAAIVEGVKRRSAHWIDTGIELLMPTYSKLLTVTLVAIPITLAAIPWSPVPATLLAIARLYQLTEVVIALRIMKAPRRFVMSLAFAPIFLVWKSVIDLLALVGHRRNAWTRTERQPHTEAITSDPTSPTATHDHGA